MFDFCTEALQERLKMNRLKKDQEEEAKLEQKRRKIVADEEEVKEDPCAMEVTEPMAEEVATASVSDASLLPHPPISDQFGSGLPADFSGEYELMGVVTHKGRSADSGHYIGWVRQAPGSDYWWKYDDDIVTEITTPEILNLKGGGDWHTAYLNFYRYKE